MSGVDYEDDYDGRLTGALVSLLMWAAIVLTATAIGYGIAWALTL